MADFHIRICGDDFCFSAAHFITLGGYCERLHGHTHRVSVELTAALDDNQCVVDFVAVREILKNLLGGLDHHVLLPLQNPAMSIETDDREVEVRFADRRWLFPFDDCILLPVANTTAELLAQYIGQRLQEALRANLGLSPSVRVEVSEGSGASAICQLP